MDANINPNTQAIPPEVLLNMLGEQLTLNKNTIRTDLENRLQVARARLAELKNRKTEIETHNTSVSTNPGGVSQILESAQQGQFSDNAGDSDAIDPEFADPNPSMFELLNDATIVDEDDTAQSPPILPLTTSSLVNDPLVKNPLENDSLENDPLVNDPLLDDSWANDPLAEIDDLMGDMFSEDTPPTASSPQDKDKDKQPSITSHQQAMDAVSRISQKWEF